MIRLPVVLGALVLSAGCSQPPATATDGNVTSAGASETIVVPDESAGEPDDAATPVPATDATAYVGRWTGVEGTYLTITRASAGAVRLEMRWDLDHTGSFDGTMTADGIRFVRSGEALVLRRTDGDAIGLKWLAGKKDCLAVKAGEGYCRG